MRFDRRQHEIRASIDLGRIRARVRRSINHEEIDPLQMRLLDRSTQARRMGWHDPGQISLPPIGPLRGRRLRIGIENRHFAPGTYGGNREREAEGGFPHPALLGDNGDDSCIQVYTYNTISFYSYTDSAVCQCGALVELKRAG